MKFQKLNFEDCYLITPKPKRDIRGDFTRIFCKKNISKYLKKYNILQINYSLNKKKGTIRGLHFSDLRKKEIKIVSCIKGKVFDVLVDIRKNSKTYGKFISIELSEKNRKLLVIPPGVAHGFQSLTDNVMMSYYTNILYNKKFDKGINPIDKNLSINWPIRSKIISKKDKNLPLLKL